MVLLKDTKINKNAKDGAYYRCFGNEALGTLLSRIQGLVIKNGYELEDIINNLVEHVNDLDSFLQQEIMCEGVLIATKKEIKASEKIYHRGNEPDFMVFKRRDNHQRCYVVELKEGYEFDTKSSAAEHRALHSFVSENAQHLQYIVSSHICGFTAESRQEIIAGFKSKFSPEQVLTGVDFCKLLEIDYQKITDQRARNRKENLEYFITLLLSDEELRAIIKDTIVG